MTLEIPRERHDDEMFEQEISPDLLNSDLGSGEIDEIHYRMTHSSGLACGFNVAFGEYMRTFDRLDPDVFVLTANSAVPVADAIRGWYEAINGRGPNLTHIYASRNLANEVLRTPDRQRTIEEDTARLAREYTGARAVVIDQFVHSGSTLKLAHRMLEDAGILVVSSTPEARWYNHAFGEIDLQNMTSEHAAFMRRIGREAVYYSSDEYLATLQ